MSHGRALIITDGGVGGLLACWAEGVVRAEMASAKPTPGAARRGAAGEELRPVAWFAPLPMPARARRRDAVARHVELCSLLTVLERPAEMFEREVGELPGVADGRGLTLNDAVSGPLATRLLLAAAEDAVRLGISRIVWPVHLGDWWVDGEHRLPETDGRAVERMAGVFERALLVGQLASIDLAEALREERVRIEARGVTIETPYVDFTDAQLVELAVDMDCPAASDAGAWVCERDAAAAQRADAGGAGRRPPVGGMGWVGGGPAGCGQCASCVRWRRALGTAAGVGAGV